MWVPDAPTTDLVENPRNQQKLVSFLGNFGANKHHRNLITR
jgi:hypothetical protein